MSPIWFTPFIIVAGALQALGAVMSAQLRVSLSNPWLALTVLFTLNAFFFAGLFAVSPRPLPTMEGVSAMPWWAPLAGLTGAVAVFAGLALVDKLGAGPVNGLIITANLLASLAIDHFGLMNMPVHTLNAGRAIVAFSWRPALSSSFGSDIAVGILDFAERAMNAGVTISFLAYWRIGVPLTLAGLGFGTWWLA